MDEEIRKRLAQLSQGQEDYFKSEGNPIYLRKGQPLRATLLDEIDKPQIAKSIMDPSLTQLAQKPKRLADWLTR